MEATVVGELSETGQFGHLGRYDRRLTIAETRDMVFLAVNPDEDPTCR